MEGKSRLIAATLSLAFLFSPAFVLANASPEGIHPQCKCKGRVDYVLKGIATGAYEALFPGSPWLTDLGFNSFEDCRDQAARICQKQCLDRMFLSSSLKKFFPNSTRLRPTGGVLRCRDFETNEIVDFNFDYENQPAVETSSGQVVETRETYIPSPHETPPVPFWQGKPSKILPILVGVGTGLVIVGSYLTGVGEVATAVTAIVVVCSAGSKVYVPNEPMSLQSPSDLESSFSCEDGSSPQIKTLKELRP